MSFPRCPGRLTICLGPGHRGKLTQPGHPIEPVRVVNQRPAVLTYGAHHRVPPHPQLPCQRGHSLPITTDAAHRPLPGSLRFDQPALASAFTSYLNVLAARDAEVAAIEAELAPWFDHEAFTPATYQLAAYRGIACWGALTLACEVIDWRRFATARACMGFTGLVASEYSSGDRVTRGHITNAGPAAVRTALIEAAWHYRHHPAAGAALTRRQARVGPDTVTRSWAAQQRLCHRFARMTARGKHPNQAVVAVARELAGFLWAEMTT